MSKARDLADLAKNANDRLDDVATSDGALSNRNLIINGACTVAQRSSSVTGVTGTGYQTTDRFLHSINALGTWTIENSTNAPSGFSNSHKMTNTTADASPASGDYCLLEYRVEAQDLISTAYGTSSAKDMTLSFYVKSNKTGSASVEAIQFDNSDKLWSGTYTVNSADTWEYKTITIPADTSGSFSNDTGAGLGIGFWLNSGSTFTGGSYQSTFGTMTNANRNVNNLGVGGATSDYFQITGVQLEVGDTATPFEHRSYGDELARCQRYFEKQTYSGGYQFVCNSLNTTTTQVEGFIPFNVEKRSSPTVTSSAASTWRVNAIANDATANGVSWFTGTPYGVRGQWTRGTGTHTSREMSYVNVENASPNEAYINVDAEL